MGPPRHYDERGPPPRHYDDRYAAPLDRYADRYGPPPPRHYDDRGPPPRHYDDRYGSSSSSSRGGSRYYEERSYDRRGGVDRYAGGGAERYYSVGDPYRDDRYSASSHGTRRPRSPSPFYRDTRPRRDYRSRSRSYERPPRSALPKISFGSKILREECIPKK